MERVGRSGDRPVTHLALYLLSDSLEHVAVHRGKRHPSSLTSLSGSFAPFLSRFATFSHEIHPEHLGVPCKDGGG